MIAKSWAWLELQQECVDCFICFGQKHMDHLVSELAAHYHQERPHESKANDVLIPRSPPETSEKDGPTSHAMAVPRVECQERLGGLLKHYYRKAAYRRSGSWTGRIVDKPLEKDVSTRKDEEVMALHPLSEEFHDVCSGCDSLDFFRYGKYVNFTMGLGAEHCFGLGGQKAAAFENELQAFLRAQGLSHPRDLSLELCSEFLENSPLFMTYRKREGE